MSPRGFFSLRSCSLPSNAVWEAHGKQAIESRLWLNENDHLAKLVAARSRMVTERREVASALTEEYKRGHTDDMRELLVPESQATIEAIDRAIADEKNMANDTTAGAVCNPAG